MTNDDIAVLWGAANTASAEQAQRLSSVLDAAEALFLRLVTAPSEGSGSLWTEEFRSDFVESRTEALREYIRASCGKLRGVLTMQSLATGDLSSGTEMMKLWLK